MSKHSCTEICSLHGLKIVDMLPSYLYVLEYPILDLVPIPCYNNLYSFAKAFSLGFGNLAVGISAHSAARVLVKSGTDVRWRGLWGAASVPVHTKGAQWARDQGSVQNCRFFIEHCLCTGSLWNMVYAPCWNMFGSLSSSEGIP